MARKTRLAAFVALARALRGMTRPGEPGLRERLSAVPRLLGASLRGDYPGTSRGRLVALAAAVLYVVSPVDLVPEALLPVLGFADDAVVISWIAATLLGETDAYLRWERSRSARRPQDGPQDDVVPGYVVR